MGIQNISMITTATLGGSDFSAYLTPDALMTYCQSRLEGIDSQVKEAFAKQQATNAASEQLGQLANAISLPSADLDLTKSADFKAALQAGKQLQAAADAAQDPATKKALQAAADKVFTKLTK